MAPQQRTGLSLRTQDDLTLRGNASPAPYSPLDKRYHRHRSALITWDNRSVSLMGILNLVLYSAILPYAGLLLDNIYQEGFRVSLANWSRAFSAREHEARFNTPTLLYLYMPVHVFLALAIEKVISLNLVTESVGSKAHIANLLSHFAYPIVGLWMAGDYMSIGGSYLLFSFSTVVFLKLWSFVQTCQWAREKLQNLKGMTNGGVNFSNGRKVTNGATASKVETVQTTVYPDNLTFGNVLHFMFAPTLCYEMDYPLAASTNWRNVLHSVVQLVTVATLALVTIDQVFIPGFNVIALSITRNEWPVFLASLLKLAVPSVLVLLCFFYGVLHVNLMLWSELTCFADRHTYDNWWDCEDLTVFWRRWNLPVHRWFVRHLYVPLIRQGFSKRTAQWATFLFSGVMHEYALSPPLRLFRIYIFLVFLIQVPLCDFSGWVCRKWGPWWGRFAGLTVFMTGLPLSFILTGYDYLLVYKGSATVYA